jgi:hypothetical protein
MWKKSSNGDVICNSCSLKQNNPAGGEKDSNDSNGSLPERTKSNGNLAGPVLRKSARIKPTKHRYITAAKALATKGKSRRIVFKKSVSVWNGWKIIIKILISILWIGFMTAVIIIEGSPYR